MKAKPQGLAWHPREGEAVCLPTAAVWSVERQGRRVWKGTGAERPGRLGPKLEAVSQIPQAPPHYPHCASSC